MRFLKSVDELISVILLPFCLILKYSFQISAPFPALTKAHFSGKLNSYFNLPEFWRCLVHINRHMEAVVSKILTEYPCVLISGPRQVGKTTLVKSLKEERPRKYVTLDNIAHRQLAKTDPEMFLQTYAPPVCIDEVQYAPELFPYIKIIVDNNRRPGDFILTGSQIFRLMHGVSESLAGRIAILNMQGIALSETTGICNHPFFPDLESYRNRIPNETVDAPAVFRRIFRGSMPAVISGERSDLDLFYSSYISTYVERDIRDIAQVDEARFFSFLTAAAARSGQILNAAEIARDADISLPTAQNWLGILETLGIIFYLHPYSNNLLKRTVKKPKLYFYDTGLVCYLTKWSSAETAMVGASSGALFETFVVSEIIKTYHNAGIRPFLYYYRDSDMKEIDLVIERNRHLHPVEIKKAASITDQRISKSFRILEKSGLDMGMGAVICLTNMIGAIDRNTLTIPIGSI